MANLDDIMTIDEGIEAGDFAEETTETIDFCTPPYEIREYSTVDNDGDEMRCARILLGAQVVADGEITVDPDGELVEVTDGETGNVWRLTQWDHVADLVVLEYMPAQHVSSHRAARNWGRYPGNGAIRVLIDRETAEEIVEGDKDEYARVIRDATARDMGDLDRVDYPADL